MNSCLYQSRVAHARLAPRKNSFNYSVFYCWVDLDDLSELDRSSCLLSVNRRGIYSIHESDHLQSSRGRLKSDVMDWVRKRGIELAPDCRIRLLTLPRFLGYVFNPVSFFYCYDSADELICGVAEVGNTFHEKKLYLLPRQADHANVAAARVPKEFYVSPFLSLDVEFDFKLTAPGDTVDIRVDDYEQDQKVLVTSLVGQRQPSTTAQLLKLTALCPAVTAKVIFLIHWQALLLWIKGIRWLAKADRPERQTNVLNPHPSIARTRS
jgi:DUF1365 family protein